VVKRYGRNESIWVVIHMCMEAMLGISLDSYLYLKLEKNPMSFLLSLMCSQQNWRRGKNRFSLEVRGGEWEGAGGRDGPNTVYTYE
jgi:hypothetical protein